MVRTLNDIKNDPRVREVYQDSDGWWVTLIDGWLWDGCGSVHEDTIKECCKVLNHSITACLYRDQPNHDCSDGRYCG